MAVARSTSKPKQGRARIHAKREDGYRSGLEKKIAEQLAESGIEWSYETEKLHYTVPARQAKYTPDFPLGKPTKIYLEGKGFFPEAEDRAKMIHVRDQNPDVDIRFVFQNASRPIYKNSPTTLAQWCENNGFKYSDKGVVPQEWIDEVAAASRSTHPEAP